MKRVFINQPSRLQPLHKYNGTKGLLVKEKTGVNRFYFLNGPVESMVIPDGTYSNGWPKEEVGSTWGGNP